MGKALYRKHRPKKLSEVIGQEHITTTLEKALKANNISHAYLFTGTRGVGKTSIARILAFEVNNLPYDEDQTHLDIIEIDAASNRRIDEIRELKERVGIAPTSAKYKVYIIDEVHMLTKEAFNALLKTLEEPPQHAIFILATTESHKVPETIISRTQRFSFKPIDKPKMLSQLKTIAKQEKIDIEDEALELIAEHSEGSFRDALSLLDQTRHSIEKITADHVLLSLGHAPKETVKKIVSQLDAGNLTELANSLEEAKSYGVDSAQLAKQIGRYIRERIIGGGQPGDLKLLTSLAKVPAQANQDIGLEITLFEAALANNAGAQPSSQPARTVEKSKTNPALKAEPVKETTTEPAITQTPDSSTSLNDEIWPEILNALKGSHNTLYGIVRMASPQLEPGRLTLSFKFAFHQKRLNESRHKQILKQIVERLAKGPVEVNAVVDKSTNSVEKPAQNPEIATISNIFGSAEVLD